MNTHSDCIINPSREKNETEITGPVLLCINPSDAMALGKTAERHGAKQRFMYNSKLWQMPDAHGGLTVCGPAIGAPMAVLALEKLIALGGKRFIVFGTCGGLHHELEIGSLLLPTSAESAEGTSKHYPVAAKTESCPLLRKVLVQYLFQEKRKVMEGPVWSTDAPYRETKIELQRLAKAGVFAVDMEFSALLTVAAFRKVALAGIFVISDLLSKDSWKPGFRSKEFREQTAFMRKNIFNLLQSDLSWKKNYTS